MEIPIYFLQTLVKMYTYVENENEKQKKLFYN